MMNTHTALSGFFVTNTNNSGTLIKAAFSTDVRISGCVFGSLPPDSGYFNGVGIDIEESTVLISNNVFVNLKQDAIKVLNNNNQTEDSSEIRNNTFYRNGDGIYLDNSSPRIYNNIFSSNTGNPIFCSSSSPSIQSNNYFSNEIDAPFNCGLSENDIVADPLFWGQGDLDDYFRLSQLSAGQDFDSPCLDVGVLLIFSPGSTRLDGEIDNSIQGTDLGFHYPPAPPTPTPTPTYIPPPPQLDCVLMDKDLYVGENEQAVLWVEDFGADIDPTTFDLVQVEVVNQSLPIVCKVNYYLQETAPDSGVFNSIGLQNMGFSVTQPCGSPDYSTGNIFMSVADSVNNLEARYIRLLNLPTGTTVAVLDGNGDGVWDYVASENGQVTYYQLDSYGNVVSSQDIGAVNFDDIGIADINGDGDVDLVLATAVQGKRKKQQGSGNPHRELSYFLNDGSGNFIQSGTLANLPFNPNAFAVGDISGDGLVDIVVATDNKTYIYENNGNLGFDLYYTLDTGNTVGVALGDANKNGTIDVATASTNNSVRLFDNQTGQQFSDPIVTQSEKLPNSLSLYDANADGYLDIIIKVANNTDELFLNENGTSLVAAQTLPETIDTNGDGNAEIPITSPDETLIVTDPETGKAELTCISTSIWEPEPTPIPTDTPTSTPEPQLFSISGVISYSGLALEPIYVAALQGENIISLATIPEAGAYVLEGLEPGTYEVAAMMDVAGDGPPPNQGDPTGEYPIEITITIENIVNIDFEIFDPTPTPTNTSTYTPIPPTDTPVPPTVTPLPTDTPVPPTNTPVPTNTDTPIPTNTPTALPNTIYYVNGETGSDLNDGLTPGTAFKTIQHATNIANGTVEFPVSIYVHPSYYAENVILDAHESLFNETGTYTFDMNIILGPNPAMPVIDGSTLIGLQMYAPSSVTGFAIIGQL